MAERQVDLLKLDLNAAHDTARKFELEAKTLRRENADLLERLRRARLGGGGGGGGGGEGGASEDDEDAEADGGGEGAADAWRRDAHAPTCLTFVDTGLDSYGQSWPV